MPRLTPVRRPAVLAALVALAATAACRDLAFEPQSPESVTYAATLGINFAQFTRLPTGVYVRDVALGSGTAAESTSTIGISYRGYLATGQAFDTTYAASTYTQPIAAFVPGFRYGLLGVRQGSRRQIIIPPDLAYGNRTTGNNKIPAGSVLFFDVNLTSVTTPVDTTATTTSTARASR